MSSASTVSINSGARPGLVAEPGGADEERRVGLLVLCLLALVVGVMTGVGAVALRALIGLFHNAFYNGTLSIWYNANVLEGPSRFGDFVFFRRSSAVSSSCSWCSASPPRPRVMAFPR